MSEKCLGRATVIVDSKQLLTNKGAKLDYGGIKRNVVKGDTVHGFAEEAMEASVEVEVTVKAGQSLKEWADIEDATIHFQADTGQVWVLRNAWVETPPVLTSGEGGRVPLKFVSRQCEELLNG